MGKTWKESLTPPHSLVLLAAGMAPLHLPAGYNRGCVFLQTPGSERGRSLPCTLLSVPFPLVFMKDFAHNSDEKLPCAELSIAIWQRTRQSKHVFKGHRNSGCVVGPDFWICSSSFTPFPSTAFESCFLHKLLYFFSSKRQQKLKQTPKFFCSEW